MCKHVGMTSSANVDMRVLALELVGEFAKAQDAIDMVVRLYFKKRSPGLDWYLRQKRVTTNIADTDRPRLVLSLANELGTSADLSNFSEIYRGIKEIRDHVSHSARTEIIDADTIRLTKTAIVPAEQNQPTPLTVTRDVLEKRIHEAKWLVQHATYIASSSDLTKKIYLGSREVEYLEPEGRPEDWQEQVFRFVNDGTAASGG